jgi:hypothetical protein
VLALHQLKAAATCKTLRNLIFEAIIESYHFLLKNKVIIMKKLFMIASLAFLGYNFAHAQSEIAQEVNPNAPQIEFETKVMDYGTIEQGSDGNRVFKFTNTGKEPLILTNVRPSCGCTTPKWSRNPIAPGETGEIQVRYNTNSMGNFHKSITVTSNAKTATLTLTIKGKVIPKETVQTTPVKQESKSKVSK